MKKGSRDRNRKTPIGRLFADRTARMRLSLFGGLVVNLLYLLFNLLPALLYGSMWAVASTVYYLVIILMRILLIFRRRRTDTAAYRTLLHVGIMLLLLDLAIIGMIAYTAARGRAIPYKPYFVLGYAAFTVYSLTSSTVGIMNSVRHGTPITLAARNLTLTMALTSAYSLQHAVLAILGANAETVRAVGIIFATVISLAVPTVAVATIAIGASHIPRSNHPHSAPRV